MTFDIRQFEKKDRLRRLSNLLELLRTGESVVMIDEVDPRETYAELQTGDDFRVEYLSSDPGTWRVRIWRGLESLSYSSSF